MCNGHTCVRSPCEPTASRTLLTLPCRQAPPVTSDRYNSTTSVTAPNNVIGGQTKVKPLAKKTFFGASPRAYTHHHPSRTHVHRLAVHTCVRTHVHTCVRLQGSLLVHTCVRKATYSAVNMHLIGG